MFRRGYDVIALGAATIDTFVWSKAFHQVKNSAFETGVGECFSLGTKIDVDRFALSTGGGATNAAATFSHLQFRAGCIAAIGDDLFGASIREDFKQRGMDTSFLVTVPKEQTAFSTILVMQDGERTVLTARGVSERLMSQKIAWSRVKAKWMYITSLGGNVSLLRKALDHAIRERISVFWNPGGKDLALGVSKLAPLFPKIDILNMNVEEAEKLLGVKIDKKKLAKKLLALGAKSVLLTDGNHGAYYLSADGMRFVDSHRNIKAVNRTGAGDSFGSGFLAGFLKYKNEDAALRVGLANAEGVIQDVGAKKGLLTAWPTQAAMKRVKVKKIF